METENIKQKKQSKKVVLYYGLEKGWLGPDKWVLISKNSFKSRSKEYVKKIENEVISENAYFQLVCVNRDESGITALIKVKGRNQVEWFDIYLNDGECIIEQNQMINPVKISESAWESIRELLDHLGVELEEELNKQLNTQQ